MNSMESGAYFLNLKDSAASRGVSVVERVNGFEHGFLYLQSNGGGTIVENSTLGLERDVNFYVDVAKATNVNIVLGTGIH